MSTSLPPGARPTTYHVYERGTWSAVDAALVEEQIICIHVNGQELATFMATPVDQEAMALGFLRSEGFIAGMADVELVKLSHSGSCVDVWLNRAFLRPKPEQKIKTSGCGGGLTFDDLTAERQPLTDSTVISPEQVVARYQDLREVETLYPITRGVHAAALCTTDEILLTAEDVGRHNTLDKLWGKALQEGISTEGRVIITTGRISSEMLGKAAKMGVPIVASLTSPTSRSVTLAQAWNITILGYVRRGGLRVYTAPQRVVANP